MRGTTKVILVFAMIAAISVFAAESFNFTNMDFYTEDGQTHVILEADNTFFYTSYKMDESTLVIEVPGGHVGVLPSEKSIATSEVDAVTIEQVSESRLKMVFTLKNNATYDLWMHGKNLYLDFKSSGTTDSWEAVPVETEEPAVTDLPLEESISVPVVEETAPVVEEAVPVMEYSSVKPEASYLIGVKNEQGSVIAIEGDGAMDYYDFVLDNPQRVVIDIHDVTNSMGNISIENLGNPYVDRVRVAQYRTDPKVARVVLDMKENSDYRIEPKDEGLLVVFGNVTTTVEEPVVKVEAPSAVDEVEIAETETLTAEPVAQVAEAVETELTETDFEALGLDVVADNEDVELFEAVDAQVASKESTARVTSFEATMVTEDQVRYEGDLISIDFKDADLKEVFRFFSNVSGLNFVLDKTVGGKITIILNDVPWDQALDIVLKNESLGKNWDNNVLRIAPVSKLSQEEAAQRKLKEEQELSVPPITITRTISYAKAADIKKLLTSVVSKRSQIVIDERTNTIIIQDIPDNKDAIVNLINLLDVPNKQVEIEARIVETSKDYARSLGVQWESLAIADAAHGNTTSLDFPHSVVGDFVVAPPVDSAYGSMNFLFGNVLDTFTLDISLSAMERDSKGKILSAPKITTQNNVKAKIESGTQIPIVTTTATDINVEFKSASLTLEVTPQITSDDTIIMKLKVDKSQPDFGSQVAGIPSITTRNAETTVLVENGGTAVIGGIFQVTEGQGVDRVPFFSKIPGLGWLFKSKNKSVRNDELLIFITPRILER